MKQSRVMSLIESVVNILVGFALSCIAQAVFLPLLLGVPISLTQNLTFAAIMTVISIARSYLLRRAFEFFRISRKLSGAMLAVIAERYRQVEVEGWDAEHDDQHTDRSMALAAALYATPKPLVEVVQKKNAVEWRDPWPWINQAAPEGFADAPAWDKRKRHDERRRLVIAGALIVAELERLDRERRAGAAA